MNTKKYYWIGVLFLATIITYLVYRSSSKTDQLIVSQEAELNRDKPIIDE